MFEFEVRRTLHRARVSSFVTPHGTIAGPFFQFVATQAAIRGMVFAEDLEALGVQVVLANTYHLHVRPGEDTVREAGGLHGFMEWGGPITTDSGGYQVFSLGDNVKLTKNDVTFRSPLDGSAHTFTPEGAMEIQEKLGADIIMPLDVCTPYNASRDDVALAVAQTTAWAKRCIAHHKKLQRDRSPKQALYGIVQGGVYTDLRTQSATQLREMPFAGFSIGGELQQKGEKQIEAITSHTTQHLPEDKPRYLMGYGRPEDIVAAVRCGIDQFDCVLPIRNARHGQLIYDIQPDTVALYLNDPERPIDAGKLYTVVDVKKARHARDFSVFSDNNPTIPKPYTKAYVHHLMRAEAPSGFRLAVLHNMYMYVRLMHIIREVIQAAPR